MAIRGGGVDPREPPVICTSTFTNSYYPKPRFFDKKLLTPLPWGQRSVLCQVKEFYRRNHSFLLKNISEGWPAKRNRIQEKHLFCLHNFCQNVFTNWTYPVLSQTEMALISRFIYKMAMVLQIPRIFPRRSCYESTKAIQSSIQGLKLTNKVDKSCTMPWYFPRVTPPGWPLISA